MHVIWLDDNMSLLSIPSLLLFHYKNTKKKANLRFRVPSFWIEFVRFEEVVDCNWNRCWDLQSFFGQRLIFPCIFLSLYWSIFSPVIIQLRKKVVPSVRLVVYSHGLGGLVREGLKGPSWNQCMRPWPELNVFLFWLLYGLLELAV